MFLQMWNISEKEPEFEPFLSFPSLPPGNAKGFVIPYGDCPLDGDKVGEMVYMDILNRAKNYVHIMTPYLILDGEMETALRFAAERGVEVKIILPGVPDKLAPYSLAKSHYSALLDSGVEIFEYEPGFIHAKSFVADNCEAVVGTINLDYRSLYHHFECAAYCYETACIGDIEKDFQETLEKCRRVTKKNIWKNYPLLRPLSFLMKIIAPLL
jgi:cardiolipin synthase